uniref:hypothetical protein n=1 Tax=Actinoplanes sp. CA-151224 TaxID=3239904 RepID=UPI003F491031
MASEGQDLLPGFEVVTGGRWAGSCLPDCDEHLEHVYVICYGRPVHVADRDFLPGEEIDYPIDHYVGYTRQHPPMKRVRSHGNRSGRHLAALLPGSIDDEERLKVTGQCPACGKDLWYYSKPRPSGRSRTHEVTAEPSQPW